MTYKPVESSYKSEKAALNYFCPYNGLGEADRGLLFALQKPVGLEWSMVQDEYLVTLKLREYITYLGLLHLCTQYFLKGKGHHRFKHMADLKQVMGTSCNCLTLLSEENYTNCLRREIRRESVLT